MSRSSGILCAMLVLCANVVSAFAAEPVLIWPLQNPVITQHFTYNPKDPTTERGTVKGHPAIDITAGYGSVVVAVARGVVLAKNKVVCPNFSEPECEYNKGNWILLYHEELGLYTEYLHLLEPSQHFVGAIVQAGQMIGYEGGSGKQINIGTQEPVLQCCEGHLHFGVMKKVMVYVNFEGKVDYSIGGMIDPLTLLPPRR